MRRRVLSRLGVWRLLLMLALLVLPLPAHAQSPPAPSLIRLQAATFDPLKLPALSTASIAPGVSTWILQFTGPVLPDWKAAVTQAGAALYGYLPDNAFIARMDVTVMSRVQALPFVRWVGPYQVSYRLAQTMGSAGSGRYLVQTIPGLNLPNVAAAIQSLGGAVSGQADNGYAGYFDIALDPSQVNALAALDGVLWIEPALDLTLSNNVSMDTIGANAVHRAPGLYGAGQVIAVADSGLDTGVIETVHPDLRGRVVNTFCDFRQAPCNWSDENGHGTHVAGTALGDGLLSGSDPGSRRFDGSYAGVAPEAKLVVQAVGGPGASIFAGADAGDLIRQAYLAGARVQNNSWGGASRATYTLRDQQVDYATWLLPEIVTVYAAGNSGTDVDRSGVVDPGSIQSPALAKNVIAVGASESLHPTVALTYDVYQNPAAGIVYGPPIVSDPVANQVDGMAAFSSRGPTRDFRIKPDIVAPGTRVTSLFSRLSPLPGATSGTAYKTLDGTSMAAPMVTGSAALLREWLAKQRGIGSPSAGLVRAMLLNSAQSMGPGQYGEGQFQEIPAVRPNSVNGWGRLNIAEAVSPSSGADVWLADETEGIATGAAKEYTINLPARGTLNVTLSWTDYPGQPGAERATVNQLSLEVTGADGVVVYGNSGVYPMWHPCFVGDGWDGCNTTQSVQLEGAAGTYRIVVRGRNVPQGDRQPFALTAMAQGIGAGPGQAQPPRHPASVAVGEACPADQSLAGVYLFDQTDFAGRCSRFTADSPAGDRWHIGNDAAQSVRVVGDYTAAIWSDVAFSGRKTSISGSIANLGVTACDSEGCTGRKTASSIQIWSRGQPVNPPDVGQNSPEQPPVLLTPGSCNLGDSGVYLYDQPNFSGHCQLIRLGDPVWFTGNADLWNIGNDAVQSFGLLPRGCVVGLNCQNPQHAFRVTLYRDAGFGGDYVVILGTYFGWADLSKPPPGYTGPWIGGKAVSAIRVEMLQLPASGAASESISGGSLSRLFVPLAPLGP